MGAEAGHRVTVLSPSVSGRCPRTRTSNRNDESLTTGFQDHPDVPNPEAGEQPVGVFSFQQREPLVFTVASQQTAAASWAALLIQTKTQTFGSVASAPGLDNSLGEPSKQSGVALVRSCF